MKNNEIVIGLVGNPNSGKTTIFNALTGARQKVANWSGVTVEKREGVLKQNGHTIKIVDLPGIYSLSSYSIEEIVARNFIINENPDVIINVVDAGNLDRNLYLTTQLIEMGAKVCLALNMIDEAKSKGLIIKTDILGTLLGMPVVETVARKSIGIKELIDSAITVAEKRSQKTRHLHLDYSHDIENEISKIQSCIWSNHLIGEKYSTRWLSIRLLENDDDIIDKLKDYPNYNEIINQGLQSRRVLEKKFNDDVETILSDMRYGFISGALKESIKKTALKRIDISKHIDKITINKFLGFPILLIFMWLLFQLTFTLGEYPMRLIEIGVEKLGLLIENILPAGSFNDMITDGIIGGVGGVIIFLPNILILFMGISFMEDTGYMARAAFIMDKIMHKMGGLHGKSFIPLVIGFGCNLPAIMATRTLENRRDRILSILINPFMSCSARLPVYVLFCGIFFKESAGNIILSLYLIGMFFAFLSARLFKYFFFKEESAPFVMELPPYRIATFKTIILHMWDRSSQYLKKMGGIILIASIIIWILGEYPKSPEINAKYNTLINELEESYSIHIKDMEKEFGQGSEQVNMFLLQYKTEKQNLLLKEKEEKIRHTFIGIIGGLIYPVIKPLGFNWQMGISLTTGFVAKEIVVSTLGVLFHTSEDPEIIETSLEEMLKREEYGITPLVAYTFMLFVLLYIPCLATIIVISKEAGLSWALFSLFYQLTIAWITCFLFYNTSLLLGF